ncbi:Diaminopimelate decarboxylase (LysA) (PDB:1D7K) [Commensalibacter communis]|uniref:type III PLP-dependent enzyme n=1 Tax=Commensalibacter communis TaxID=2972786 RepID=UPI0022FF7FA8|nr:type III PLP-dependent enzyme [Commensalibacter communis]CAI3942659.1 Diaminopimelate decarboxylase (LysA) (PDB:1D7K) [Commensalibacter communis]
MNPKISQFLNANQLTTPCLIVDIDQIEKNYQQLHHAIPNADIYYAVKANPALSILNKLISLNSFFDAASWEEIQSCLNAGAKPSQISFGNTIKKTSAIQAAYQANIELYAFDTTEELHKLAKHAPATKVYCRLAVDNIGADWPLSGKFGTTVEHAIELLLEAKKIGLCPYGVSFHVGSQQTDPHAYVNAIEKSALVFNALADHGILLEMINLGGGFPIHYHKDVPEINQFATTIQNSLIQCFGDDMPRIILEPGRYLVGNAGVVSTEIIQSSQRGKMNGPRWVYLDIGRFGGLAETEGEAIRYPITTMYDGSTTGPVILAGPSCDGVDVLYQKTSYHLPLQLTAGDRIALLNTGAYVSTYCSTCFNGFTPLEEHYI